MFIKKKKKKKSKPYVNVTLQSEQSHAASHTWPIKFKTIKLNSLSTTLSDLCVLCFDSLSSSLNFGVITHICSCCCWIWVGILWGTKMAGGMNRKISAASARAHTRRAKQNSSFKLPSGPFFFLSTWSGCSSILCYLGRSFNISH